MAEHESAKSKGQEEVVLPGLGATEVSSNYKVAAVQASPVFLDIKATVEKACHLIEEAARHGAALVVFPETWITGYPVWGRTALRLNYSLAKKVHARLYKNSVDIPGPVTERLGQVAQKAGVFVVMGVHERVSSGTLYNTIVFIDSDGQLLGKHRKLVPTYWERQIWGYGDGSTLQVFDTKIGRLGGLVCWENWMPLARYALYAMGEQVHAALWPSASETFLLANRNMAYEGKLFVIAACSYATKAMLPADLELKEQMESYPEVIQTGGSAIIGPDAAYLAGPVYDQETIVYADIHLDQIIEAKHDLDVVGHYARPEVFTLHVNRSEMNPVVFDKNDGG